MPKIRNILMLLHNIIFIVLSVVVVIWTFTMLNNSKNHFGILFIFAPLLFCVLWAIGYFVLKTGVAKVSNKLKLINKNNIMNNSLKIIAMAGILIISISFLWAFVGRPYVKENQDKENYRSCLERICGDDNQCPVSSVEKSLMDACVKSQ